MSKSEYKCPISPDKLKELITDIKQAFNKPPKKNEFIAHVDEEYGIKLQRYFYREYAQDWQSFMNQVWDNRDSNEYSVSTKHTDAQLADICALRHSGKTWPQVARSIENKYKIVLSDDAARKLYEKYGDSFQINDDESYINTLKSVARTKRTSSRNARENRQILDYLNKTDDILERTRELVNKLNKQIKISKPPKRNKSKKNMTLEVMLSDIHLGKKTDTFDSSVARRRIAEMAYRLEREIDTHKKIFNVERIIVALLGDMIESATMHAVESARGCEFGNSRQVVEIINILLEEFFIPIAKTGLKIDVVAVPGNHDRSENKRTYHNPGEECLSFIVYKMLEQFCKQLGLTNIDFKITKGLNISLDIYGNIAVYEHTDEVKALTRAALESRLNKLQNQLGQYIHFYRGAHYHEFVMFGRGKFIINESLVGPDSYSEAKGFCTHSGQTINSYVETKERPTCFFRTFPIYLT